MTQQNKDLDQQRKQPLSPQVDEVARQKQKAEQEEVAGRHKNEGQNDHKGNRRQ